MSHLSSCNLSLSSFLIIVIIGVSSITYAQGMEYLIKENGDTYLGLQISNKEFKSCSGTIIKIGSSKIVKTKDQCDEGSPIRPKEHKPKPVTGTITELNLGTSRITLTDKQGAAHSFFVPQTLWQSEQIKFVDLKKGSIITVVDTLLPGRAETIKFENRR